jgi:Uma2 family endonuclease
VTITAPEQTSEIALSAPADSVGDAFEVFSAAAPDGWRVELIEGDIHVTPPANGEHEEIISDTVEQVIVQVRAHSKGLRAYTGIGLRLTNSDTADKVEPDIAIAPRGSFRNDQYYHSPEPVLLVAEITSKSTGRTDRTKKLRGYASASIPLYLLIDRNSGRAVLHSEPAKGHYTRIAEVELGKPLALPEPLGFELDTSEF